MTNLRFDLDAIAKRIGNAGPASRVLDVGCGDGALMAALAADYGADVRGVELDPEKVERAVAKGLSVIQGDANTDLANYPDKSFDFTVLSRTLQTTNRPDQVLEELLRVADVALVSFPNFAHWRTRSALLCSSNSCTACCIAVRRSGASSFTRKVTSNSRRCL